MSMNQKHFPHGSWSISISRESEKDREIPTILLIWVVVLAAAGIGQLFEWIVEFWKAVGL